MEFNATIIVSFVSFIVFVFIMNWILYKPIGDIVEKRKRFIDENYNKAKNNSDASKVILKEREDKLTGAHFEAQKEFLNAIESAKNNKEKAISLAKKNLSENIKGQIDEFKKESAQAEELLKQDIVRLARMISDKFIDSSEEIDSELIDKVVQR